MPTPIRSCICVLILSASSAWSAEDLTGVPKPPAPQSQLPPVPTGMAGAVFHPPQLGGIRVPGWSGSAIKLPVAARLLSRAMLESCENAAAPSKLSPNPPSPIRPLASSSETPDSELTPIQHLRKAADHLEAADEWDRIGIERQTAAQIRDAADHLQRKASTRLKELTEQSRQIQQEIAELRRLTRTPEQVQISCTIVEISSDHLQQLMPEALLARSPSGEVGWQSFFAVSSERKIDARLTSLVREDNAKILAQPRIITRSGRPATIRSGGEFPIPVPQESGSVSIEWREFGVRFEAVPHMLGNERIRLAVNPEITERDLHERDQD